MKKLNVGLCAFGMSGKIFHAPFYQNHPGFELKAIVERTKNDSKQLYSNSTTYRSVEELLMDESLDLIVINTPIQTHFEYCKKAIEAGKHIIIEKPFTVNANEARLLVSLAKEKGVMLSVFQNRRFDRDFLQVKDIIDSKKLGKIKEVEIRFDRYRTQPSSKQHKENPNLPGSGALHDLGAHLIDQAVQLFGMPYSIFADVLSMKGTEFANDYFELLLFYSNELRVRLKSSVFTKEDHYAYKIHGINGSFLQERSDSQEEELVKGIQPKFGDDWVEKLTTSDGILNYVINSEEEIREELWSSPSSYMSYFEAVYQYLINGSAVPSPGEEIILNMEIIDAALQSTNEGKRIQL